MRVARPFSMRRPHLELLDLGESVENVVVGVSQQLKGQRAVHVLQRRAVDILDGQVVVYSDVEVVGVTRVALRSIGRRRQ